MPSCQWSTVFFVRSTSHPDQRRKIASLLLMAISQYGPRDFRALSLVRKSILSLWILEIFFRVPTLGIILEFLIMVHAAYDFKQT